VSPKRYWAELPENDKRREGSGVQFGRPGKNFDYVFDLESRYVRRYPKGATQPIEQVRFQENTPLKMTTTQLSRAFTLAKAQGRLITLTERSDNGNDSVQVDEPEAVSH
jgi:hypothetical protein